MRLTVSGLRVRRRWRTIIEDAAIDIDRGAHGLFGENGSGKTTLLRCLATGIRATSGEYKLDGQSVRTDLTAARKVLGYAPQRPVAIRHLTTAEQVGYAAWLKGCPLGMTDRAVDNALEQVDLANHRKAKVGTLSGGMLKRLGVAMAIVGAPRVILLDEPTAGLDVNQQKLFHELISGLKEERTILLSSHIVDDFTEVCDDVIVLHNGRTVRRASPHDLRDLDGLEQRDQKL